MAAVNNRIAGAHAVLFAEVPLVQLKRRALSRLERLNETIAHFAPEDAMTKHIADWAVEFETAVRSEAFSEEIKNDRLTLLEELLVDALPCRLSERAPFFPQLDEESLLGSDGRVYGKRWLSIVLSSAPEEARWRSPLNTESEEVFFVIPHRPVQEAIRFLREEGKGKTQSEIDEHYSMLFRERAPFLPEERNPLLAERRLLLESVKMKKWAEEFRGEDALSGRLRGWIDLFHSNLRRAPSSEEVLPSAIASLKEIFIDYGDQVYLGSDGRAYGHMRLSVIVSEGEWPHTATKHHFARTMADWLYRRGVQLDEPIEIKERYQVLVESGTLKRIPISPSEQRACLEAIRRNRDEARARRVRQVIDAEVARFVQPLREEAAAAGNEINRENAEIASELLRIIEELEREVHELNERTERLGDEIAGTDRGLDSLKREIQQLNRSTEELRKKIKKEQKSTWTAVFAAIGSIVVTIALNELAPGSGAVLGKGGGMFTLTVPTITLKNQ